jgi:hypothetical protein
VAEEGFSVFWLDLYFYLEDAGYFWCGDHGRHAKLFWSNVWILGFSKNGEYLN